MNPNLNTLEQIFIPLGEGFNEKEERILFLKDRDGRLDQIAINPCRIARACFDISGGIGFDMKDLEGVNSVLTESPRHYIMLSEDIKEIMAKFFRKDALYCVAHFFNIDEEQAEEYRARHKYPRFG